MKPTDNVVNWLRIRLAPGMTRAKFYALMRIYDSPEEILNSSAREISFRVSSIEVHTAQNFRASETLRLVEEEISLMEKHQVIILTRDCEGYPENLQQSFLTPPLLYVTGSLYNQDRCAVAMVGSRKATQYGRSISSEFSEKLAGFGLTIISGFARGIDIESHLGAIRGNGRTVAVLGSGLAVCYPSEHRGFVDKVRNSGALVSEYPMRTSPDRFNFPERNHLIAALSLGVIVVEAAEKSGTLITTKYALEENRFLFAVPGDIVRQNSRGTNRLIQEGARMVIEPKDVLIEMRHILRGYLNEDLTEEEIFDFSKKNKQSSGEINGVGNEDSTDSEIGLQNNLMKNLSEKEMAVLSLIRYEPRHFDVLANEMIPSKMTVQELSVMLMQLELRGIIKQLPGRVYATFNS